MKKRYAPALVLVALAYPLFFFGVADRDLWSSHEARAAQDAQSILTDGHWALPQLFDRKLDLQKPPLYYWLVALAAQARGEDVDAWAVRLPAALSALGGVLLVYLLLARRGRPVAGLCAGLVLATAIRYTWMARIGRIDMPLTLTTAAALAGFYSGRGWGRLAGYLALAAAVLLKGPIGLVLPLAVAGVHLLVEGQLAAPWRVRHWLRLCHQHGLWWGLPLTTALALPWFVWADRETGGELFRVFFWKHNVERGFGDFIQTHPWWYYGPRFLADFLPWSLPLLGIVAWASVPCWRCGLVRGGGDPEARFGLVWLVTILVVLSCFRFKRSDYLLPAYPGAALFLGCVAEHALTRLRRPRLLGGTLGGVVAACVLGWLVAVGYVFPLQEPGRDSRPFAREVRSLAPQPALILFFRAEAHALAFHVGRPIDTLLEWENLDVWAARGPVYVVVPQDVAREWPQHLRHGRLEEVVQSNLLGGVRHNSPLLLMRACPGTGSATP